MGCAATFMMISWIYSLAFSDFNVQDYRWAPIIALVFSILVGIITGVFISPWSINIFSSFFGSYVFFTGVDYFVQADFSGLPRAFVWDNLMYRFTNQSLILLCLALGLALVGILSQWLIRRRWIRPVLKNTRFPRTVFPRLSKVDSEGYSVSSPVHMVQRIFA